MIGLLEEAVVLAYEWVMLFVGSVVVVILVAGGIGVLVHCEFGGRDIFGGNA